MSKELTLIPADHYLVGLLEAFRRVIWKHLILVVLVPLAVMTLTYFAVQTLRPVYAAQATVRIGRIDGSEAMSLQTAVTRINSEAFKQHLLRLMNLSVEANDRAAELIFYSLTARPATTDSATVRVHAPSHAQLRQSLDLTVRLLNDAQEEIQGPLVADIRAQMVIVDANIARLTEAQATLTTLTKTSIARDPLGEQPEQTSLALRGMLLSDLVARNARSLLDSRVERLALAMRLNPARTYPTVIVDDIYVLRHPVFPRPVAMTAIAGVIAFLGVLLGGLIFDSRIVGRRT
jgi:hypothetical protein